MDTVRNLRTSMTVYPYTYTPGLVKKMLLLIFHIQAQDHLKQTG